MLASPPSFSSHRTSQTCLELICLLRVAKGGEFAWRDGPLLAALKAGHWVVLDEVRGQPTRPADRIRHARSRAEFAVT